MFPDFYVGQPLNVTKVVDLIEFVIDFTNWFYFILGVSIVFPPNWNKGSHFSHEVYLKEAEG